jgi:hypothetical protein
VFLANSGRERFTRSLRGEGLRGFLLFVRSAGFWDAEEFWTGAAELVDRHLHGAGTWKM